MEAVFARGDRRLCKAMALACERGFHFDGWNDCFDLQKWLEIFDECGMAECGMVIDPEYLQKYSHVPFSTESLNLKKSGLRNTDALVLTEASCLVLRYPNAHMRIIQR